MLLSVLLLAIFAIGIVSMAVPVKAIVEGEFTIVWPDKLVPGGALLLYLETFDNPSGTTYFYFSEDDEAYISSGDVYVTSMKTSDIDAELADWEDLLTVEVPSTVDVEPETDYYVKLTDRKVVDQEAIVSKVIYGGLETVEFLEEADYPTITVDPESGVVYKSFPYYEYNTVDVDGEDIDTDYDYAWLFWDKYQGELIYDYQGYMESDTADEWPVDEEGEFSAEGVWLDEAFMGEHSIFVLLWDEPDDVTLGTFVKFTVEPSVVVSSDVADFSVEADELDQFVNITAHGFPEDTTLAEDSIDFIIKDIETGEDVTKGTKHDEIDVEDEIPGTFAEDATYLEVEVDEPPEGLIDVKFTCDGEVFTLENQFLSSTDMTGDPGEHEGTLSPTSGEVGDDVLFYVIDLPEGVDVIIVFVSETGARTYVAGETADENGAIMTYATLDEMAGGEYDIIAWDYDNDYERSIGTFEVLPTVTFYDWDTKEDVTSAYVDDEMYIIGSGFPEDSVFDTIVFGGEEIEFDDEVEISADGVFNSTLGFDPDGPFEVPHISGGGKDVLVEIKGEDADGDPLTIEETITIDPRIQAYNPADDEGFLALTVDGGWMNPFYDANYIFGGHPMKITGVGFLADESVTVTFISDDEDIEEACLITSGGEADSDGDLEVFFMLPKEEAEFASTITDVDLEVAGTTDTNKDSTNDRFDDYMILDTYNNAQAVLFFGLEDDCDLDLEVQVGDEVRIVGVGFKTKSLTLEIEGDEVGTPTAKYGFFDTTITIPELQRSWHLAGDSGYTVDEIETGRSSTPFSVLSKVTLSLESAAAGAEVTAYGTGFVEDEEVAIEWPDLPTLATPEADSDGSWEETFTVPDVEPGPYTITFDVEDLPGDDVEFDEDWEDPEITFMVLGPLKIASLNMPGTVYNGTSITISVNVQTYFGTAVSGATVTGKITPPVGAAITLTFPATDASGITSASWDVPADAAEGTYKVAVTASKPVAGADATASGTFFVEVKLPPPPPPPPVDISKLEKSVADLGKSVTGLSGDLSSLATDVSGLKSDIAALEAAIAAIPIVPVEWIYITAIMAIIAAIAAIAAVVAVYRKIA